MYFFFLISVQYFVMKLCTGVLGITLIITNTFILTSCLHPQGIILEYFGAYYVYFLRNVQYVLMKFCTDILGVSLRVTALFFPMLWPSWGASGGIFGLILGNVRLMLHNCSIFPHEVL